MDETKKKWEEKVLDLIIYQEEMYEKLGECDWDFFKENEEDVLEKKIPLLLSPFDDDDEDEGETIKECECVTPNCKCEKEREKIKKEKKELKDLISKLTKLIIKNGKHEHLLKEGLCKGTYMSLFYAYGYLKSDNVNVFCQPVFRVPKDETLQSALFIDLECRVYKTWDDFFKNNELPPGLFCYPRNGMYSRDEETKKLLVDVERSPSSSFHKTALQLVDTAGAGVSIGCCVVGVASILSLPVAAPVSAASAVAGTSAAVYGAVRAGASLVDRGAHGQSVGLDDPEARNCWLATIGGAVGTAASAATMGLVKMAAAGKSISTTTTTVVTALNATSLAVGGIGTFNGFLHLQEKYKDGDLNTMDALLFSANMLLLFNASVKFQTAQTIVRNTQDNIINNFKDDMRSNRHRKAFTRIEKRTMSELGTTEGRAQVIRTVNHIHNKDEFMSAVVRNDKAMRYTRSNARFGDGATLVLNKKLAVNPEQLAQVPKDQKVAILRATQRLSANRLSEARFNAIATEILPHSPGATITPTTNQPFSVHHSNKNYAPNYEKFADHQLFYLSTLLSTMEKEELDKILSRVDSTLYKDILNITHNLYKALNFQQGCDFLNFTNFVMGILDYLLLCIFDATLARMKEILDDYIPRTPTDEMSKAEYALYLLKYLVENQDKVLYIYYQISEFIDLIDNVKAPWHVRDQKNISVLEFIPMLHILVDTDISFKNKIILLAEHCFDALGYRKMSTFVKIVNKLLTCLDEAVEEIRASNGRGNNLHTEKSSVYDVLDSMCTDKEVIESLIRYFCENIYEPDD